MFLQNLAALNDPQEDHYDSDSEQDVDESAHGHVEGEAK